MSSIQKELEQLEKWLANGSLPRPEPSHSTDSLLAAVERLSKQFEVQQHALNHIVDRLDILEGVRNEPCYMDLHDDPWLDHSPTQLQNEIIDPIEPFYHICKTDTMIETAPSPRPLEKPLAQPLEKPLEKPLAQPIVEQQPLAQPIVEQQSYASSHPVSQLVEEEEQQEEEEEQQEEEEEQQEEEEEQQEEEQAEEPKNEDQEEEEQQEEEEEEGESVETIEYKGVSYYKDSEGFIYSIEEDQQPSEIAIGYWKEKTNSVAFYKK